MRFLTDKGFGNFFEGVCHELMTPPPLFPTKIAFLVLIIINYL